MNKKIIMILTLAISFLTFPAFADIGAVAPISSAPMFTMAKASDKTTVTAEAMMIRGSQSQTASCQTCHSPDRRPISHRKDTSHVKHNQINQKPIVTAGAVFMHPD